MANCFLTFPLLDDDTVLLTIPVCEEKSEKGRLVTSRFGFGTGRTRFYFPTKQCCMEISVVGCSVGD